MAEQQNINAIALQLMQFQNTVKLYHWHTPSYARHKASDRLFNNMVQLIDKFMETMQGGRGLRVSITKASLSVATLDDNTISAYLHAVGSWLVSQLPLLLLPDDTELLNIRDELLEAVNQTLYLFTFK